MKDLQDELTHERAEFLGELIRAWGNGGVDAQWALYNNQRLKLIWAALDTVGKHDRDAVKRINSYWTWLQDHPKSTSVSTKFTDKLGKFVTSIEEETKQVKVQLEMAKRQFEAHLPTSAQPASVHPVGRIASPLIGSASTSKSASTGQSSATTSFNGIF